MRVGRWLSTALRVLVGLLCGLAAGCGFDVLAAWRGTRRICVVVEARESGSVVEVDVSGRACGVGSLGVGAVGYSLFVLSICYGVKGSWMSLCDGGLHCGTVEN